MFRTNSAFAALKDDGSVHTWGHERYGGDCSQVREYLNSGVKEVFNAECAFAALKDDGSVYCGAMQKMEATVAKYEII